MLPWQDTLHHERGEAMAVQRNKAKSNKRKYFKFKYFKYLLLPLGGLAILVSGLLVYLYFPRSLPAKPASFNSFAVSPPLNSVLRISGGI
jgi:hypothetical protein